MSAVPRVADLSIRIGTFPPGATASVLDVPGVGLGHATVWRDEPDPPAGRGVARTGVTVLLPADDTFRRPVSAGAAVLNGAGECTGVLTAREWGLVETPVFLTSTMQVGRVYDAACELLLERDPEIAEDVVIPVVGECDDSWLSDVRRMQVCRDDVAAAWAVAEASVGSLLPPDEGSVGAGTGMSCLGFKGGIGTSSRVVPSGHTVGVVLLCNFGERGRLTVDGVPVGRLLPADPYPTEPPPAGSCLGVVVTDAPLLPDECERLARRIGLGLARAGSTAQHGSGEIFVGLANGLRSDRSGRLIGAEPLRGCAVDDLFAATVDAAEEAVLNALLASPTVVGRGGHARQGLPVDDVRRLLVEHGRG
jgi:D-aminopeptidase